MEKTILYQSASADLNVIIEAYFNENDELIIDGCDSGNKIKQMMDDYDYEYNITVIQNEVYNLYDIFSLEINDKQSLLQKLKSEFNDQHAFSKIKNFLMEKRIRIKNFNWV